MISMHSDISQNNFTNITCSVFVISICGYLEKGHNKLTVVCNSQRSESANSIYSYKKGNNTGIALRV